MHENSIILDWGLSRIYCSMAQVFLEKPKPLSMPLTFLVWKLGRCCMPSPKWLKKGLLLKTKSFSMWVDLIPMQGSEYVSNYLKGSNPRNHPVVEFPLHTAYIIPTKSGNVRYKELTLKMCGFKSKYQNVTHVENHSMIYQLTKMYEQVLRES